MDDIKKTDEKADKILKAYEVAKLLKVKIQWVYSHAQALGGAKIGHVLFFTERTIFNALQRQKTEKQSMESSSNHQPSTIHPILPNKAGGKKLGKRNQKRLQKAREIAERKHGLVDL